MYFNLKNLIRIVWDSCILFFLREEKKKVKRKWSVVGFVARKIEEDYDFLWMNP